MLMFQPVIAISPLATASPGDGMPTGSPTDPLAVALILAGVAILAIIFMLSARKRLMQRASTPSPARLEYERLRRQSTPADDPDVANARLHERSQQLAAVLDNKAARLEQLIAEADARITALERKQTAEHAQSQPERRAPTSASASASANTAASSDQHPQPVRTRPAIESKPAGISPGESLRQPSPSEPVKTPDPTTASVYKLADAGLSPVEIAQRIDEQIGKVELILALRPRSTA